MLGMVQKNSVKTIPSPFYKAQLGVEISYDSMVIP